MNEALVPTLSLKLLLTVSLMSKNAAGTGMRHAIHRISYGKSGIHHANSTSLPAATRFRQDGALVNLVNDRQAGKGPIVCDN